MTTIVINLKAGTTIDIELVGGCKVWLNVREPDADGLLVNLLLPESVVDALCIALAGRVPVAVRDESGV